MENTLNSRKREHIIVILCIFQMFIIKLRNWIILFKLARLLVTHNGGKLTLVRELSLAERFRVCLKAGRVTLLLG